MVIEKGGKQMPLKTLDFQLTRYLQPVELEELTFGGMQSSLLKLLCSLLREGWLFADCKLRLAAVVCDVLNDANSGALSLVTGDT